MANIELDYGALAIDTCVFIRHGIEVEKGLFSQLQQFSSGIVKVVIPDIVHREVLEHLTDKIRETRADIVKALKGATKCHLADEKQIGEASALLNGTGDAADIAERRLNDFYMRSGVEILKSAKFVDIDRLVAMYFDAEPPFEEKGRKKDEFPDALALLALEAWARDKGMRVLAVSDDNDWKRYAKGSDRIDVVGDLGEAIDLFHPHNAVKGIISSLKDIVLREESNAVLDAIGKAIKESLDGAEITVDADSAYYYEEDEVYAEYNEHTFIQDTDKSPEVNVIRVDENCVVVQLAAVVECNVHCSFSFYMWDGEDKEYMSIGCSSPVSKESYETDILLHLTGDFSYGMDGIEVDQVEVLNTISSANFDEVEPDFDSNDDPIEDGTGIE